MTDDNVLYFMNDDEEFARMQAMFEQVALQEEEYVRETFTQLGFGRVMQIANKLWRETLEQQGLEGGQFAIGPCETFTVKCHHPILDKHGHCDLCCGCGWITKGVQSILDQVNQ